MSLRQSPTQKAERRRGVFLTQQGLQKLRQAKVELGMEPSLKRYTLETLSEQTGLTPTTLSKIFTNSAPVDKRTVESCFMAFQLTLLPEDYLYAKSEQDYLKTLDFILENRGDRPSEIPTILSHQNTSLNRKMDLKPSSYILTLPGGQIPLNSGNYIDRPIVESRCYEAIQQPGSWINICASKQMGKTSLMTRILTHGQSQDYFTASVNLQETDGELLQLHQLKRFLIHFVTTIQHQLNFPQENSSNWQWNEHLGIKTNITSMFENLILTFCDRPLILAIDELTQLFENPPLANEFLLLLRTWSEQAKINSIWRKLRLVTVNSTERLRPTSLDPSLLNTGLVIELPEFSLLQIKDLAHRFEQEISEDKLIQLITLLGGHPYRLHLAFYHLRQETITLDNLLNNPDVALSIYSDHIQQQQWNLQRYPQLWEPFNILVQKTSPISCETEQGLQLQRLGLVRLQGNQASLTCELFRLFFHNYFTSVIEGN